MSADGPTDHEHTTHRLSLAVVLLVAAVAPAATATAPVDTDAVGDLTVTTAPASVSADAAVEAVTTADSTDSLVVQSGVAVFRLNVSGVPAEADDDGALLGDELTLALQQTSSSVDAGADSEGVAVRATEEAVYVAVDLATATFRQGNGTATAAVGDSFTATAAVTEEVTAGENHTRTATFGVVEPSVNFLDGVDAATAGETVEFTAATLLAPGSTLTISLTPSDGGETRTTTATETATETDSTETSTSGPGFGVVAALLALLGAGAVVGRRE